MGGIIHQKWVVYGIAIPRLYMFFPMEWPARNLSYPGREPGWHFVSRRISGSHELAQCQKFLALNGCECPRHWASLRYTWWWKLGRKLRTTHSGDGKKWLIWLRSHVGKMCLAPLLGSNVFKGKPLLYCNIICGPLNSPIFLSLDPKQRFDHTRFALFQRHIRISLQHVSTAFCADGWLIAN